MKSKIAIALLMGAVMTAGTQAGIWRDDDLLPWQAPFARAYAREVADATFRFVAFGKLKIIFEETRLTDVAKAVGAGRIEHQGDAAGSYYWLCYRFEQDGRIAFAGIFANGEMGGTDHKITDVMLTEDAPEPAAQCPLLPQKLTPVALDLGLSLGSDRDDFTDTLGPPGSGTPEEVQESMSWILDNQIHLPQSPEPWWVGQWVGVMFRNDKATTIRFGQTTSD